MSTAKWRKATNGTILTLLAVLVIMLVIYILDKLVNIWWYQELGYEFYFWQRMLYSYTVFIVVILVFAGFFFSTCALPPGFCRILPAPQTRTRAIFPHTPSCIIGSVRGLWPFPSPLHWGWRY